MSRCENVYEEWCPNSNLFTDVDKANRWAEQRGLRGRVLALDGHPIWERLTGLT